MCPDSTTTDVVAPPPTQVAALGHHQPTRRAPRAASPVGFTTTVTFPHPSHPRDLGHTRQVESRVRLTASGELLLPWRKFMDCLTSPKQRYRFVGTAGERAMFARVERGESGGSEWMRRTALIWMPAADCQRAVRRFEQKAVVA